MYLSSWGESVERRFAVVFVESAVTWKYIHLSRILDRQVICSLDRAGTIECTCKFECSSTVLTWFLLQTSTSVHASLSSLASGSSYQRQWSIAWTAVCDLCPHVWFGHSATPWWLGIRVGGPNSPLSISSSFALFFVLFPFFLQMKAMVVIRQIASIVDQHSN